MSTQKDDYRQLYISLAADTDYIVESVAIANGTQTIANQPDVPRNITIAVTDANASISAGTVVVTGLSPTGVVVTETLTFPTLTLTGTATFSSVTSVVVAGIVGATGVDTLIVGIGSNIQVKTGAGILRSVIVTETAAGTIGIIDGTSGTTVNILELKASIVEKPYIFNCAFATGLRIILGAGSKCSIIYS